MAAKKDAFEKESAVLKGAKEFIAESFLEKDDVIAAYKALTNEYEELLEESKFLTKFSDKLQRKLDKANDKLQVYNEQITLEADLVKKKNARLSQEKSEISGKLNKFQVLLIVLIVSFLIIVLLLLYIFFHEEIAAGGTF